MGQVNLFCWWVSHVFPVSVPMLFNRIWFLIDTNLIETFLNKANAWAAGGGSTITRFRHTKLILEVLLINLRQHEPNQPSFSRNLCRRVIVRE